MSISEKDSVVVGGEGVKTLTQAFVQLYLTSAPQESLIKQGLATIKVLEQTIYLIFEEKRQVVTLSISGLQGTCWEDEDYRVVFYAV